MVALGVGALLLVAAAVPSGPARLASFFDAWGVADMKRRRRFVVVTAFVAAFLSLGYLSFYLRGGPRAPEAAVYWLEGRALSHGALRWSVADPAASFRTSIFPYGSPNRLAAPLAPGFPLLLGFGFLLGAPMIVGPLIAACLVAATWMLGHELAKAAGEPSERAEATARTAAGLSVLSVALRFHTCEALPYGAAALAVTVALACAMRARRLADPRWLTAAGAAVGAACAAAPWSSVAAGLVVVAVAARSERPARAVGRTVAAALPGVVFLVVAHRLATGFTFSASQATLLSAMAYARPATMRAALIAIGRTSLHGLRAHLADVANLEVIALAPIALAIGRTRTRAAAMPAVVLALSVAAHALQVLSHAPLAAEGVARWARAGLLAELLPIEHALVALSVARLFPPAIGRAAIAVLGLACVGFAVHVSYDHEQIATSGAGRPRYEPDVPRDAGITHGLVFFEDDEGYALAADPYATPSHDVLAARLRGDDHDRLLFDILGHPPAHRYVLPHTGAPTLPSFSAAAGDLWRFEAEADLVSPTATLVGSVGCGVDVHAVAVEAGASAIIELPIPRGAAPPERRTWQVMPRILDRGGKGTGTLDLFASPGGPPIAHFTWTEAGKSTRCFDLNQQPVELGGERARAWWVLSAQGGSAALDRTMLRSK
jgi:hypothetical protein